MRFAIHYFTSPQWETTSLDDTREFTFPYHMTAAGTTLALTPAADVEDYYSFTRNKED